MAFWLGATMLIVDLAFVAAFTFAGLFALLGGAQ